MGFSLVVRVQGLGIGVRSSALVAELRALRESV